jgi:hypothetical protein
VHGHGLHVAGVTTAVRLGEAKAAQLLAPGHRRQPLFFLLLGAELVDGRHRQGSLHRNEGAPRAVNGFNLVADKPVAHRAGTGAAVAVEVHAEEAGGRNEGDELPAKVLGVEVVFNGGSNVCLRKLARLLLPSELLVTEQSIKSEHLVGERYVLEWLGHVRFFFLVRSGISTLILFAPIFV